jgi:hypothetical protein
MVVMVNHAARADLKRANYGSDITALAANIQQQTSH